MLGRQGEVGLEVAPELLGSLLVLEQVEGGEAGQVEPAVEDQRGLEAAVGVRQAVSMTAMLAPRGRRSPATGDWLTTFTHDTA